MLHTEKSYLIENVNIVRENEIINDANILVENGIIKSITQAKNNSAVEKKSPKDFSVFDAGGKFAGTALCDMHIHGAGGFDTASFDRKKNLEGMANFLTSRGITSFQPTIVADLETLREVCDAISESDVLKKCVSGVYMEGPFIAPEKKGGLPAECIHSCSDTKFLEEILSVQYDGKPLIRTMTLAPELENAEKISAMLDEAGVKVAWGHSAAFLESLKNQPRTNTNVHITHLFNAMNGIDHRKPGLAAVPFLPEYENATFELICDTVHVKPEILSLVVNSLGTERLCVISDAMSGAGLGAGETTYLGKQVVCDGKASYYKESATLIGSAALICDTARDLCKSNNLSIKDFFRIASSNPKKILGTAENGKIAEGNRADIILVDDDFNITDIFF